jgi:hypothetical protein
LPVRTGAAFVALLWVALLAPAAARADADPASDILYTQSLYQSYQSKPSAPAEAELIAALQHAAALGKPVRVALIATPNDLGGVPQLFGKPTEYARFLDAELQFVYSGRLLVVMPQGAGLAKGGRLVADKSVVGARPAPGRDGLARTATGLVQILSGVKSETASPASNAAAPGVSSSANKSSSGWVAVLIALGAVVVLVGVGLVPVLRRRR